MAQVFYKLPNGQFLKREVITGTKYLQAKRSRKYDGKVMEKGQLYGRKKVESGGDRITRSRVTKPFTLVKESKDKRGHVRKIRQRYEPGHFI